MELLACGFNAADTLFEVFIACELSQRLGNAFTDIYELIDQFQWYRFPTKVRRILPMALGFVQQPVSLECFGTFVCCRDAFKRVNVWTLKSISLTISTHVLYFNGIFIGFEQRLHKLYGASQIHQVKWSRRMKWKFQERSRRNKVFKLSRKIILIALGCIHSNWMFWKFSTLSDDEYRILLVDEVS